MTLPFSYCPLFQARPANALTTLVYTPEAGINTGLLSLRVTNTSMALATFRLYVDIEGKTWTKDTAVEWDVEVLPGRSWKDDYQISLDPGVGSIAVQSSVGGALTFLGNGWRFRTA